MKWRCYLKDGLLGQGPGRSRRNTSLVMHFGKKIVSLLVSQVWLGHANVAGGDVGCGLREGLPRLAGLPDSMQDDGQFASYGHDSAFFAALAA